MLTIFRSSSHKISILTIFRSRSHKIFRFGRKYLLLNIELFLPGMNLNTVTKHMDLMYEFEHSYKTYGSDEKTNNLEPI